MVKLEAFSGRMKMQQTSRGKYLYLNDRMEQQPKPRANLAPEERHVHSRTGSRFFSSGGVLEFGPCGLI